MLNGGNNRILLNGAVALLAAFSTMARCEPRVPQNDSDILERVPAAMETRRLEPLRRHVEARPDDLHSAMALARGYLDIGQQTSDPRFVSYAQVALAPWLQRPDPPVAALVLSATALQRSHRFPESMAALDRALLLDPSNVQAWLTKATVLQVQGRFDESRQACTRLFRLAGQLLAFTCVASVDSHHGHLDESYRALHRMVEGGIDDPTTRSWVMGQLAEMAVRRDDFNAAGEHYRAALHATPGDIYLKAAYADLMLMRGQDRQVMELLKDAEDIDALLLRLAIAGRQAHASQAAHWVQLYDARRRAARPDDNPHLREHARFLLDVMDSPAQALVLARRNWQIQREAEDVRIYVQAAHGARQLSAAAELHEWIRATGYEDRTLRQWRPTATSAAK